MAESRLGQTKIYTTAIQDNILNEKRLTTQINEIERQHKIKMRHLEAQHKKAMDLMFRPRSCWGERQQHFRLDQQKERAKSAFVSSNHNSNLQRRIHAFNRNYSVPNIVINEKVELPGEDETKPDVPPQIRPSCYILPPLYLTAMRDQKKFTIQDDDPLHMYRYRRWRPTKATKIKIKE